MIKPYILKQEKYSIPKFFAYKAQKSNVYKLANDKGNYVGYMTAFPNYVETDVYYPDKTNYFSFYIKRLFVDREYRGNGAGKALLNIAAKESYRNGCDGCVHLTAGKINAQETKLPHKFYWRNNFVSSDEASNKSIKKAIENNTEIPGFMGLGTPMYLKIRS